MTDVKRTIRGVGKRLLGGRERWEDVEPLGHPNDIVDLFGGALLGTVE